MSIDLRQRLSPHFTLAEMTVSQWAARNGVPNIPNPAEIAALTLLCKEVLEPIRLHFERPVLVSSGFRNSEVNAAIGGSPTSQHAKGQAADIRVGGVSNYDLCDWVHRHLDYDQLIYEFGETGWCHVSYSSRMRNQELSAKRQNGRVIYLPGIVR